MLIETLATLGTLTAGAIAARAAWRLASAEDARRRDAIEAERLRLAAQVEIARAQAAAPPALPAHYAPVIHYHAGNTTTSYAPHISNAAHAAQATPQAVLPHIREGYVPAFDTLLATRQVGKGQPLLLGYAEGKPLYGSWLDLYSTAIAGKSGSGKSTSMRFFAAQTALHGARFVICDKHYGAGGDSLGESLEPLLATVGLCEVASTEQAILQAVQLVQSIGAKRIAGGSDRQPVILWIDEANSLLARSEIGKHLTALLEQIAQEYRKVGVYASISGQVWKADRIDSNIKHSLASVIAHRMHRDQARSLLPAGEAGQAERLETGTALLYRTSGETATITIPNTRAEDVQRVAALLTDGQPTMQRVVAPAQTVSTTPQEASGQPDARLPAAPAQTVSTTPQEASGQPDARLPAAAPAEASIALQSPEAARIIALFREGHSIADITKLVHGVASSQGRKYQQASEAVQAVLRQVV